MVYDSVAVDDIKGSCEVRVKKHPVHLKNSSHFSKIDTPKKKARRIVVYSRVLDYIHVIRQCGPKPSKVDLSKASKYLCCSMRVSKNKLSLCGNP